VESQAFSSDASIIGQIESGNIFRLFDFRDLVTDNCLRARTELALYREAAKSA
jgi:hypothetical protein